MAIVKLSKFKLYGMNEDKDLVIDTLHKLKLVHIKNIDNVNGLTKKFDENEQSELNLKLKRVQKIIEYYENLYQLQDSVKLDVKEADFFNFEKNNENVILEINKIDKILQVNEEIRTLIQELTEDSDTNNEVALANIKTIIGYYNGLYSDKSKKAELTEEDFIGVDKSNHNIIKNNNQIEQLLRVIEEKRKFTKEIGIDNKKLINISDKVNFNDSPKMIVVINGILEKENISNFIKFLSSLKFTYYELHDDGLIEIISNKEEMVLIEQKFEEIKLKINEIKINCVNNDIYESYLKLIEKNDFNLNNDILVNGKDNLHLFKTYYDYLSYKLQKLELDKNLGFTQKTFMLEGFVEEDKKQILEDTLKSKNLSVSYEFTKPNRGDNVPTKTRNKKLIKPFEFVTNMYSVPKYNEIDPNFFVGIFFSLFFGFIMADIAYGILLTVIGLILVFNKKTNQGMKDLMKVVAIGGVFGVFFGILFGSCLGYTHNDLAIIPKAVFPDPSKNVMLYLIASVVAGAIQIMVSFALKGILLIRRGKIAEAICSAFAWDLFFIGAGILALDLVKVTEGLLLVGIIVACLGVGISVIGNLFINKGFERVSKSFGSLYSILNLFSDLLSYTRLFGLMLSGVIIATIVNQLAGGFYTSAWKIPFGLLISFIGHAFNISMGALGAYIHDARLQYIEFFSRFYEGEGELFTPFGSKFSYINLIEVED